MQTMNSHRKMSKISDFFRFFLLIAALVPLSCATRLPAPKGLSSLNDNSSIVFGKIEATAGDKLLDPKPSIFHPVMQCLIRRYAANDKLNKDRFTGRTYAFKIVMNKNSYFSFVIPPGKYYFFELQYFWLFSGRNALSVRPCMVKRPFCMGFDVPANRAVYIGTILNKFEAERHTPFFFQTSVSIGITNNFQEAKNWFLKLNPELETNIVERYVKITPL